jgi:hypothetical protein
MPVLEKNISTRRIILASGGRKKQSTGPGLYDEGKLPRSDAGGDGGREISLVPALLVVGTLLVNCDILDCPARLTALLICEKNSELEVGPNTVRPIRMEDFILQTKIPRRDLV